jgi:Alginate export
MNGLNLKNKFRALFVAFLSLVSIKTAFSQTTIIGQVRPRAEYRNGVGRLMPKDTAAAGFVSQRTRLIVNAKLEKVAFGLSIQDVRVWGQDASTINNADGAKLGVHEAWAEVALLDSIGLSVKLGRQELLYDDSRLLGNLDWLQQARRHDALVFKLNNKGWQVDLGGAFNQNTDAFGTIGTFYTAGNTPQYALSSKGVQLTIPLAFVPTATKGGAPVLIANPSTNGGTQMYKTMQYLYAAKKFGNVKLAGLFFKDDFAKYRVDSIGSETNGYVYGRRYDQKGVNSRLTYGLLATGVYKKAFNYWFGAYAQSGKNRDGKDLSAYTLTAFLSYTQKKFTIGAGYDLVSGDDQTAILTKDNKFDPLYGTPHKFWGYMDFFYVGTGAPAGGLANPYLRLKYAASPKFTMTLDAHNFSTAKTMVDKEKKAFTSKQLGNEFDLILNYTLNKFTGLEFGYCFAKFNDSFEYIKNGTVGKADQSPTWAYMSLNIRPELFSTAVKK